ncbi:hypothetical protein [Paracoccus tibetensis]|uniref:hypothetical protein n=1 Tax=Paracoccus tibetensis TaxID=336292 RepID=UPI001587433A|nr:hypothetical protein [Paracoccus tibetensis]
MVKTVTLAHFSKMPCSDEKAGEITMPRSGQLRGQLSRFLHGVQFLPDVQTRRPQAVFPLRSCRLGHMFG